MLKLIYLDLHLALQLVLHINPDLGIPSPTYGCLPNADYVFHRLDLDLPQLLELLLFLDLALDIWRGSVKNPNRLDAMLHQLTGTVEDPK
jgi:hypothetical protein